MRSPNIRGNGWPIQASDCKCSVKTKQPEEHPAHSSQRDSVLGHFVAIRIEPKTRRIWPGLHHGPESEEEYHAMYVIQTLWFPVSSAKLLSPSM